MPDFGENSVGAPERGIFGYHRLHATNSIVPLALARQLPCLGIPGHLRMGRRLAEGGPKHKQRYEQYERVAHGYSLLRHAERDFEGLAPAAGFGYPQQVTASTKKARVAWQIEVTQAVLAGYLLFRHNDFARTA